MDIIAISSDHAGFELKKNLIHYLEGEGIKAKDFGPNSTKSVDYPDYGSKVAQAVVKSQVARGIVICGTGIGMSIAVNRYPGVRGALCADIFAAKLCREHNDSNILILGGRMVGVGLAKEIVKVWMNTPFKGGRHQRRLDKINTIDENIKKGEL